MDRHCIIVNMIRFGADVNKQACKESSSSTGGHQYFKKACSSKPDHDRPLSFAVESGYISLIRLLVAAGARLPQNEIRERQAASSPFFDVDELLRPIIESSSRPASLAHSCRLVVRRSVFSRRRSDSRRRSARINVDDAFASLPVASRLRRYLMFDDLDDVQVERAKLLDGAKTGMFQMQGAKPTCGLRAIEESVSSMLVHSDPILS